MYVILLLGIGDWGLGIGPNPQSPIPNPLYTSLIYTIIILELLLQQLLFL